MNDEGIAETRRYRLGLPAILGLWTVVPWLRPSITLARTTTGGNMDIKRNGSQASNKGPADWFTGTVRIDPLFDAPPPARAAGAAVTFEPGARTAWHTHPLGQTLIVTAGVGRVQRWGGPVEEIRPRGRGVVPAERKALARRVPHDRDDPHRDQEKLDGKMVDWLEHVTADQYGG